MLQQKHIRTAIAMLNNGTTAWCCKGQQHGVARDNGMVSDTAGHGSCWSLLLGIASYDMAQQC